MKRHQSGWSTTSVLAVIVIVAIATAAVTALLVNVFERKSEAKQPFLRLVEVTEDTTDPAEWGINFPTQYDSYLRTAESTRTRFGGHGGSEALPEQKIERDPWLKRMFLGYAFSIDSDQAANRVLSALPRIDHASVPQAGRRRCHGRLREELPIFL
jgi:nitrite reductase (cytochrome c-552)